MSNRELFRERMLKSVEKRGEAAVKKYQTAGNPRKAEERALANDFASAAMDVARGELDGIVSSLPKERQYSTKMESLRQTKRAIMVEEHMEQAINRQEELGQNGFNLTTRRWCDTFCNWMLDGNDRVYAHAVVSQAIKMQAKKPEQTEG